MSDVVTALSTMNANGHQNASMLAVKQAVKAEKQMIAMISELIESTPQLNSSGRGQLVNTYA